MIAAFFDIDHTIISGPSMERIFFKYLMARGYIKGIDIIRTAAFIFRHLSDTSGIRVRSRRPYLQGKSVALTDALASQCFHDTILPLVSKGAIAEIRRHQEAGHHIVLLSGTLEMLARPLCHYVKADHYIACIPEEVAGYFTGRIVPPIPYGEGKRQILISYAKELGIDLKQCFAYGDSMADIGVFESIGDPYVVNPGRRLRAIAGKRGWTTVKW